LGKWRFHLFQMQCLAHFTLVRIGLMIDGL
jgi:hypothetical protein